MNIVSLRAALRYPLNNLNMVLEAAALYLKIMEERCGHTTYWRYINYGSADEEGNTRRCDECGYEGKDHEIGHER